MVDLFQKRTCPFCGARIELGRCPVVATADSDDATGVIPSHFGVDDDDQGERQPRRESRSRVEAPLNDHLTLPQLALKHTVGRRLRRPSELLPSDQAPARECPICDEALPLDLDAREMVTVALVGTKGASKSHYLASAYVDATQHQVGRRYGISEFSPDEDTGDRLEENYFVPLYIEKKVLEETERRDANRRPFVFRITMDETGPFGLILHDAAGEDLANRRKRAANASFVPRADAIIYLIDPYSLPVFRDLAGSDVPQAASYRNQARLLQACVDDVRRNGGAVPLVMTLAKSDAVERILGHHFTFNDPSPDDPAVVEQQRVAIDGEVRAFLEEFGGSELLGVTSAMDPVSFHAVAAIGSEPEGERITRLEPRRCFEPIVSALANLAGTARLPSRA
jgi:hypothetical protein